MMCTSILSAALMLAAATAAPHPLQQQNLAVAAPPSTKAAGPFELAEVTPILSTKGATALWRLIADLKIAPASSSTVHLLRQPAGSPDEFMSQCLDHVHQLVNTIDQHYTDVQLESVLVHDCELTKEFPATRETSYKSHEACLDFAKKLTNCRMQELQTGKSAQYQGFCQSYYEHLGGSGALQRAPAQKQAGLEKPKWDGWDWAGAADPRTWFESAAPHPAAPTAALGGLLMAAAALAA